MSGRDQGRAALRRGGVLHQLGAVLALPNQAGRASGVAARQLRQRLAQLPDGYRYFREGANGERIYYSDEELDAARRQVRERLAERCS